MGAAMLGEMGPLFEALSTVGAGQGLLANADMAALGEALAAVSTDIWPLASASFLLLYCV